jgi:cytochrome P450
VVALRVMIAAGHETTTNLISNTLYHLLENRELWQALVADPALAAAAVEEGLRFDSSVIGTPRVATEALPVGAVDVPAKAKLRLMIGAVGRDPGLVDDPDTFRLDRSGSPKHHGFGYGVHFCIGAPLARLEARIALETLVETLPGLRLDDGFAPSFVPGGFTFHGLQELPVSWG